MLMQVSWLRNGGYSDGRESFGDNSVRLQDADGDAQPEILASYGPVASHTDVYRWDGRAYVYVESVTNQ